MDLCILEKTLQLVKLGKKVALVILTKSSGSTPRKEGTAMSVWDESFIGTIGGGMVEHKVIELARKSLNMNQNQSFSFDLNKEAELGMSCGGSVEGYIKIVRPKNRVVILGAGHIGKSLYQILEGSDFETIIIDDREEYKNLIPNLKIGNYNEILKNISENENTYFVIVTRGHETDSQSLKAILEKKSRYIGMVGSKKKIVEIRNDFKRLGLLIPEEKFYSPVGLKLSDGTPYEIAVEILAEILSIKNDGELRHRRSY
ncbi:XdhC family protein [uncultured Cetobacterium sp.]|uniref:XdhC family protein n=1 Tax=uncultured Cetobacterium sp. TaxID=527638 RepID=UPI002611B7DA|nr:XdhC/CoxI family protein [uncultured Cetobacterium sp.]